MTQRSKIRIGTRLSGLTTTVLAIAFSALATPTPAIDLTSLFGTDTNTSSGVELSGTIGADPQEYNASRPIVDQMFTRDLGDIEGNVLDLHGAGDAYYYSKLLPCAIECLSSEQCLSFNYVPDAQLCRLYSANRYTGNLVPRQSIVGGRSVIVEYFGKTPLEMIGQATEQFQRAVNDTTACIFAVFENSAASAADTYMLMQDYSLCEGTETRTDAADCANAALAGQIAWDAQAASQPIPNAYTHWQPQSIAFMCKGAKPQMGVALAQCVNDNVVNRGMTWDAAALACRGTMATN